MSGTLLGELLVGSPNTDPTFGPCRWQADYTCQEVSADASEEMRTMMEQAATELLWSLSGRQFGECGVTLRPCVAGRDDVGRWWWYDQASLPFQIIPSFIDGTWLSLACGACGDSCSCGAPMSRVVLPNPVTRVTQIVVDGVELPDTAYQVLNRIELVRVDGGTWPTRQDLSKRAGEVGTWSVFGFYGREVPGIGRLALAELTAEFVKSCLGDKTCQIPANWTSITRGGVSISRPTSRIAHLRDLDVIPEEWLPMTRRFLRAYNPYRLQSPSTVWSPDIPRPTRTF